VIAHLVERRPQLSFAAFVAEHPQLHDRILLLVHYTPGGCSATRRASASSSPTCVRSRDMTTPTQGGDIGELPDAVPAPRAHTRGNERAGPRRRQRHAEHAAGAEQRAAR
jgi:hypothetical protein